MILIAFWCCSSQWLLLLHWCPPPSGYWHAAACFFCTSSGYHLIVPQTALELSTVSTVLYYLLLSLMICCCFDLSSSWVGLQAGSLLYFSVSKHRVLKLCWQLCPLWQTDPIKASSWLNSPPPGCLLIWCSYQKSSMLTGLKNHLGEPSFFWRNVLISFKSLQCAGGMATDPDARCKFSLQCWKSSPGHQHFVITTFKISFRCLHVTV